MFNTNPITIADIARLAGVSTATVDRVINGRQGVNPETTEKVKQAVESFGETLIQPGRPRSSEQLRFGFVLPDGGSELFSQIEREVARIASDLRHQHITVVTYRFSAEDANLFAQELDKVRDCDGIILLAVDVPQIKRVIADLVKADIHVITLISDVAGSARQLFVGGDNRAAGRTAGLLLGNMARGEENASILLVSQATRFSAEIERRIGFAQVMEERFPSLDLLRIADLPVDDQAALKVLCNYFDKEAGEKNLAGVYVVGNGMAVVVQALEKVATNHQVGLIASELCEPNASMLGRGEIHYLLYQDIHYCVLTAANAMRKLCEKSRGALNVVQPRIEILTVENLH